MTLVAKPTRPFARPFAATVLSATLVLLSASAHANLLVNGGFEGSSSNFTTPPGWFNFGHTDGVLGYAQVGTQPVYEGLNFYSLGGAGNNGNMQVGEGIAQTFATIVGARYRISYGYSAENVPGAATETLRVSAAGSFVDHVMVPNGGGVFTRPWVSNNFEFVASATTTTLSFILTASAGSPGNNDPLIDGVNVVLTAVPEPQSWALLLGGLVLLQRAARRSPPRS